MSTDKRMSAEQVAVVVDCVWHLIQKHTKGNNEWTYEKLSQSAQDEVQAYAEDGWPELGGGEMSQKELFHSLFYGVVRPVIKEQMRGPV